MSIYIFQAQPASSGAIQENRFQLHTLPSKLQLKSDIARGYFVPFH